MNTFWALVKNDTKFGTKFSTKKLKWFWVYFIGAVLIGMVQYTIFLISAKGFSFDITYVLPVFLLVYIYVSGRIISDERRRDTIGWWMSLPHSRKMLIGAKMTASFIRFLKSMAVMIITIVILFLEAYILRPDLFTGDIISNYFTQFLQLIFLLLAFSPIAVVSGILIRIVIISKWRPAAPLFWICIPTGFTFIMSIIFDKYEGQPLIGSINWLLGSGVQGLSLLILMEVLLAAILGFLSVYILEKQVEV